MSDEHREDPGRDESELDASDSSQGGDVGVPPDSGERGYGGDDDPPGESRPSGAFRSGGWVRRLARLWGFLAFCVLVLVLARNVILPFVFAMIVAYVLAPVVRRMSFRKDGSKRMPVGVSIIFCYIVLISALALFVMILMPRISNDAARIGREAPKLYQRLNDVWAPKVGRWLENRFPSLAPVEPDAGAAPVVADVPLPPRTSFVLTPLPDGRYAVQLTPAGIDVSRRTGGGFSLLPNEEAPENLRVEDKLRAWAKNALASLQNQLGDLFRFSRELILSFVRSFFTFFLMLMVAAFVLLDLEKLHGFVRNLFPAQNRDDYDVIVAGIDRGLSGVIRGQLLICLVNGILTYIGLMIFGVKYQLILAVVAATLSLIPIFGSILSTIPIVIAALVSGEEGLDFVRGFLVVWWIVGIHMLEANFLNPKIIGTAAKIHPVLVIFALFVGEHGYGLVGALLAVPVASVIQVLFLFFRRKAWKTDSPGSPVTAA